MAVPNTNTFTMRDVCNEIGVSYSGTTLTELFSLAEDRGFDDLYKGNKNSLYNFRNYNHHLGLRYDGLDLIVDGSARGIYVNQYGEWAAYVVDGAVKTVSLSNDYDISSVSNTYTYNTPHANQARGVVFASQGLRMYIVRNDRRVSHFHVDLFYRPDLGVDLVEVSIEYSFESFYIKEDGQRFLASQTFNNKPTWWAGELNAPYSLSISFPISSGMFSVPSLLYGAYGHFHYSARVVNGGEVEVSQYLSGGSYNNDGMVGDDPHSVELVQFLPPIASVQAIYPSPNGYFLYLNAVGAQDGVRRIWQLTMSQRYSL